MTDQVLQAVADHQFAKKPEYRAQRRKSIEAVKNRFEANLLGAMGMSGCRYSLGKKTCVVGAMFSKEQIADIKQQRANTGVSIARLAEKVGRKNIIAATGFTIAELTKLQLLHDNAYLYGSQRHIAAFRQAVNTLV